MEKGDNVKEDSPGGGSSDNNNEQSNMNEEKESFVTISRDDLTSIVMERFLLMMEDKDNPVVKLTNELAEIGNGIAATLEEYNTYSRTMDVILKTQEMYMRKRGYLPKVDTRTVGVNVNITSYERLQPNSSKSNTKESTGSHFDPSAIKTEPESSGLPTTAQVTSLENQNNTTMSSLKKENELNTATNSQVTSNKNSIQTSSVAEQDNKESRVQIKAEPPSESSESSSLAKNETKSLAADTSTKPTALTSSDPKQTLQINNVNICTIPTFISKDIKIEPVPAPASKDKTAEAVSPLVLPKTSNTLVVTTVPPNVTITELSLPMSAVPTKIINTLSSTAPVMAQRMTAPQQPATSLQPRGTGMPGIRASVEKVQQTPLSTSSADKKSKQHEGNLQPSNKNVECIDLTLDDDDDSTPPAKVLSVSKVPPSSNTSAQSSQLQSLLSRPWSSAGVQSAKTPIPQKFTPVENVRYSSNLSNVPFVTVPSAAQSKFSASSSQGNQFFTVSSLPTFISTSQVASTGPPQGQRIAYFMPQTAVPPRSIHAKRMEFPQNVRLPGTPAGSSPASNFNQNFSGGAEATTSMVLPTPSQSAPNSSQGTVPSRPELVATKIANGLVLSWTMDIPDHMSILTYEVLGYEDDEGDPPAEKIPWGKVGDVKAMPLPMACTLTQFAEGRRYYFVIRAVDTQCRMSEYSNVVMVCPLPSKQHT